MIDRVFRPAVVYLMLVLIGAAAFLYPFWLPGEAIPAAAHSSDAPLIAALVGGLVLAAVTLEARRGEMNGSTVALLGVLSAFVGILRLLDLPGGGSGLFFLLILAGVAFGPRFGLLLGVCAMAVSALITGGLGPWLPFQMIAAGWMGASAGFAGLMTRRLPLRVEVLALAAFGWFWGFAYGAIMNLWFWPFVRDGGPLSWSPGLDLGETLARYWSFYSVTSFAWDAAGALANATLILMTGPPVLSTFRRFASRLQPVVDLVDPVELELPHCWKPADRPGPVLGTRTARS